MSTETSVERKRGGCLTAFLVLMLIVNPLAALYYLLAGFSAAETLPTMPAWTIPLLGVLSLANFVFALALWQWKKWGLFAFGGSALIVFVINTLGLGILAALPGLVGLVLLSLLVRPVWHQME